MNHFKGLFLFACALLLAAPAGFAAGDRAKEQRWAGPIVDRLIDGEALWLGPDDAQFLAIHTPDLTGTPKGGVVLVHGMGAHPDWQEVIRPLRVRLPEHGWATLSVQMPTLPDDAAAADYAPLVAEAAPRLRGALDWLQGRSDRPVFIVAHSLGAIMATAALSGDTGLEADGLVLIGMGGSAEDPHLNGAAHLERITLPVLDLFGSRDLDSVLAGREARARAARRAGNDAYRQVEVTGADHYFTGLEAVLVRRVRGWLASITDNHEQERSNP
ncbi:MAG TPA: alpha/beta fold hydrolase [Thiohalobacter sp.]|nr:alpha/beta fold hydrolase [Thiohalobacter sp.]